jgi:hypothetical protein
MSQFEGGPPLWHVSASIQSTAGPVPLNRWSEWDRAQMHRYCLTMLVGIGDAMRQKWEYGARAIHLRRVLSDEEAEGLGGSIEQIRAKFGKGDTA